MADSINIILSTTPSAEPFLPTAQEKAALKGVGNPSGTNKFVTNDTLNERILALTDKDLPSALPQLPSVDEKAALEGTGIPTAENKFVTADTLQTTADAKVNKETGKGLSTNDYTTDEKTKLAETLTDSEFSTKYKDKTGGFASLNSKQHIPASKLADQTDTDAERITQAHLSDELIQQIAGTTPVNAVVTDGSITGVKLDVSDVIETLPEATSTSKGLFGAESRIALDLNHSSCHKFTGGYIKYDNVSFPTSLNIKFSFTLEQLIDNAVLVEGQYLFFEIKKYSGVDYLYSKIGGTYFNAYQSLKNYTVYNVAADIDDNAKTVKIYINGVKVIDSPYTGSIIPPTEPGKFIEIGGAYDDSNWFHKGYVWDARINGTLIDTLYISTKTSAGTFAVKSANELNDYLSLLRMLKGCRFNLTEYTYDANGIVNAGNVLWEDGSAGVLTYGNYNILAFDYDSFEITHTRSGLKATQPTVTRNEDYQITVQPEIIIS